MRKIIMIGLLALAGCGDPKVDAAKHRAAVTYAQEALCSCLHTGTWLKDCVPMVRSVDANDPASGATESEMLHAQCLNHH